MPASKMTLAPESASVFPYNRSRGTERSQFRPASTHGITCAWDVPDDVFMLLVLDEHAMRDVAGPASYLDEFSGVV
jgi:hypothetical protein